ncbi:MAG: glycosyltransferase family 4 protein [Chloroflexi bacterium]|nr:glycosyltransferase family 4 protein [Chloroflexota bacterium]
MSGIHRVGIPALFLQRPYTGTGQYVAQLLQSLETVQSDWSTVPISSFFEPRPGARLEDVQKLLWEQVGVPLHSARAHVDLLHVPYWASPFVARQPVVVTIHDIIPLLWPQYLKSPAVRTYTHLVAHTARRATVVVTDSECSRRDALRILGLDPRRVVVVPLAARAPQNVLSRSHATQRCRERWSITAPFVLYVGSNDIRKNVDGLLRAWQRAAQHLPDHLLVIAGHMRNDPPLFPDIRGLAAQLRVPRVVFLEPPDEDEKVWLFGACDAFVWPSHYEGFGLPVLEAMQLGAAVVSSSASSMPEVAGDAALLVDPASDEEMATAMVDVCVDAQLRTQLQASGRARSRLFTWERTARETIQVYELALRSSR